mmetsp:Transcript_3751/g.9819  ORF Transcript_3751/g.9819 Transcript_3751/m.9819 type:complete len:409 (+) Transcript_3751:424-1650(+)
MRGREKPETKRTRIRRGRRPTNRTFSSTMRAPSSMRFGRSSLPTTFAAAVTVLLFLLPSYGTPLSSSPPSSRANVPSDPCRELAKRRAATGESSSDSDADVAACSRYHPDVFDGRVCLGCFCDEYEISNWEIFSIAEKAYAFEDASDRMRAALSSCDGEEEGDDRPWFREGSIPEVGELKRDVSIWSDLAKNAATTVSKTTSMSTMDSWIPGLKDETHPSESNLDSRTDELFTLKDDSSAAAADNGSGYAISIPSSVTVSSGDAPPPNTATGFRKQDETVSVNGIAMAPAPTLAGLPRREDERPKQRERKDARPPPPTPPPPTPCTRICRYNANCYDGEVCIGCFRDTHDIARWSGMSSAEKAFSLEDAADRCRELSDAGRGTNTFFEGGISEDALRSQGSLWSAWEA